eukprot:CAMPEP_0183745224 /NCGR_PEP_ID=MMETSP0737-20130205/66130_1 /TAXON_ID=385413 /ORGANISM="Thalassiosira miniscula, Strain CCMP1093" /LENGTH=1116 /DNA_ID=CAMNT_0025980883 /DNA_START=447 /DNA_END=3798 /DNA_ORIENTATION=-
MFESEEELLKQPETASKRNSSGRNLKQKSTFDSEEDLMKLGRKVSRSNSRGGTRKSSRSNSRGGTRHSSRSNSRGGTRKSSRSNSRGSRKTSNSRSRSNPRSNPRSSPRSSPISNQRMAKRGEFPPPPPRKRSGSGGKANKRSQRLVGRGTSTSRLNNNNSSRRGRVRPRSNSTKDNKQQQKQNDKHNDQPQQQQRSKSMPPIGSNFPTIYVDHNELYNCPVSPVASVDSSWRYKMIKHKLSKKNKDGKKHPKNKQTRRGSDAQRTKDDKREEQRVQQREQQGQRRSKSCKPSLAHGHKSKEGNMEGTSNEDVKHDEDKFDTAGEMAIVPYDTTTDEEEEEEGEEMQQKQEQEQEQKKHSSHEPKKEAHRESNDAEENTNLKTTPSDVTSCKEETATHGDGHSFGMSYHTGVDTWRTGDDTGPWRGRAPEPVMSIHGSSSVGGTLYDEYGTILSPGTYGDGATFVSPRSRRGPAPDPPTIASEEPTSKMDPPSESLPPKTAKTKEMKGRDSSPDSFIERGSSSNGGNDSDELGNSSNVEESAVHLPDPIAATASSGSQGEGSILDINSDEGNDERSIGSLLDSAPSTTTNEKKIANYAPPPHSKVRSMKPMARSKKVRNERKSKKAAPLSPLGEHARSARSKDAKNEHPQIAKVITVVKQPTKRNGDDGKDYCHDDTVSEITMPMALRRAPPLHARIRAKKPTSSNRLSSNSNTNISTSSCKESKDDKDAAIEAALNVVFSTSAPTLGPMTGNEVEFHPASGSTKTDPISEVTMPVALHAPFAQMVQQSMKQHRPSEQKLKSKGRGGGGGGGAPSPSPEKSSLPLRPKMTYAPPPRRTLIPPPMPPPPRHHAQQHNHHRVAAAPPPRRTLIPPPMPPPPRHHAQQHNHHRVAAAPPSKHAPNVAATNNNTHENIAGLYPQREDNASPLSGGNRMARHYSRSSSIHSLKSWEDPSMVAAMQLSGAAAQLLSLSKQSAGGSSRNNNMKSPSRMEYDHGINKNSGTLSHSRSSSSGNANILNSNLSRQSIQRVDNMPFMDQFHGMGLYTGEVSPYGQPHGMGRIMYDNGGILKGDGQMVSEMVTAQLNEKGFLPSFTSWKAAMLPQSSKTGKHAAYDMT